MRIEAGKLPLCVRRLELRSGAGAGIEAVAWLPPFRSTPAAQAGG